MKKILIVDDDKFSRDILSIFLRKSLRIKTAENGYDAIEKAKNEKFDAIIIDISMPLIDGFQTLQKIRENGASSPAIAISGSLSLSDEERVTLAGFSYLILKPFSKNEILNALDKVIKIFNPDRVCI